MLILFYTTFVEKFSYYAYRKDNVGVVLVISIGLGYNKPMSM